MAITKRCSICKKPVITKPVQGKSEKNWICPACQAWAEAQLIAEDFGKSGELCRKCKNYRNGSCSFRLAQRQKITMCSNWIGRNTEHDKRRWAKFET